MATNANKACLGSVPTVTRRDLSSVGDDVLQQYAMRDGVDCLLHRRDIIQQLFLGRSYIPALDISSLTTSPWKPSEDKPGNNAGPETSGTAGGRPYEHERNDHASALALQTHKRSSSASEDLYSDGKRMKTSPTTCSASQRGKGKARDPGSDVSLSPSPASQPRGSESQLHLASDTLSPSPHCTVLDPRLFDYDGDADSEHILQVKLSRKQRSLSRKVPAVSPSARTSSASPLLVNEKHKKRKRTYDELVHPLLVNVRQGDRASGDESEVSEVDTDSGMEKWKHRGDAPRETVEWWKERKIAKLCRREEKKRREEVRAAKKEWKVQVDAVAAAAVAEDTHEDDEGADAHPPRMPVYHPVENWEVDLVVLTDKARRIDRVTRREERMWARHNALVAEGQGYEIPDDPLVLPEDCSGLDTDESDPEWEKADWQFASYRRRHSYAPRLHAGLNRLSRFWDMY